MEGGTLTSPPTAAFPHKTGPDAVYSPEEQRERAERQARLEVLRDTRKGLAAIPTDVWLEIPGRPHVSYTVRDFTQPDPLTGRQSARAEVPFLFKAFETGQAPPPRPGTKKAEQPRAATIHEYLDWTVTNAEGSDPDDLDFGGFRVVVLHPRYIMGWPPPGCIYNTPRPLPPAAAPLSAPHPPVPSLEVHHKAICAATIRLGPGFLEVPFYATHESRRNRGYGRALLEAIETIARQLGVSRLLLCSTDDPKTKATWQRLGFQFTQPGDLEAFGVRSRDLLHMDNTVQMHKTIDAPKPWRPLMLKHGDYMQRLYFLPGGGDDCPGGVGGSLTNGFAALGGPALKPGWKPPAKKRPRKR